MSGLAMVYDTESGQVLQFDHRTMRTRHFDLAPGRGDLYGVSEDILALDARGALPAWEREGFELYLGLADFLTRQRSPRYLCTGDTPAEWARAAAGARAQDVPGAQDVRRSAGSTDGPSRDRPGHHRIRR